MVKRKHSDHEDDIQETPQAESSGSGLIAGQPGQSSTLFVSNLPYTATSTDLETLFSDFAPVRSAFIVLEHATSKSKGVGYVSFAMKEDVGHAIEKIEKDGLVLDGRKLRVQRADTTKKHAGKADEPQEPKPKKQRPDPQPTSVPRDPNAIRTLIITGLPDSLDAKPLWKRIRKLDGAEKIEWPVTNAAGDTVAHAIFSTPAAAVAGISRLHAHTFKGATLTVVLKKRIDSLAKTNNAPSRATRLITRNLPFATTEQDLRELFLPYGPIHSVTIPSATPGRSKGFAFVWMLNKNDAEKAIDGVNGRKLGTEKGKERVVAVDWALSKDRWQQEKAKIEADDVEAMPHVSENESEGTSDSDSDSIASGSDEDQSEDEEKLTSGGEESEDERSDNTLDGKPRLPLPETGHTLFVRNVPFEATEEELRILFRRFGPLRYARITMDHATGRSRGTGFVCFWNKEHADSVMEQAELLKADTGTAPNQTPIVANPFKLASVLTPDPSSSLAHSFVIHGRTLDIIRAVTREEAGRLREEGERQREKEDKRNLYLMREGVIFPNSTAASTLSPAEVEKRLEAFNTRKQLLRSNPSLYISKTRLSARQLPQWVTERVLKRLAIHAMRAFEDDVNAGTRESLTADELHVDPDERVQRKRKKGERPTAVRQAKLVRIADKVDALTGKGLSKGYGFLEMFKHADALRVLRWANNNPIATGLMREWWREELQDLASSLEKGNNKDEDRATRLKRAKDKLAELGDGKDRKEGKGGKTLTLEFSIENIQVVKRRQEKEENSKAGASKRVERKRPSEKSYDVEERRPKKRRVEKDELKDSSNTATHNPLGSLIGKKRKERKAKRK